MIYVLWMQVGVPIGVCVCVQTVCVQTRLFLNKVEVWVKPWFPLHISTVGRLVPLAGCCMGSRENELFRERWWEWCDKDVSFSIGCILVTSFCPGLDDPAWKRSVPPPHPPPKNVFTPQKNNNNKNRKRPTTLMEKKSCFDLVAFLLLSALTGVWIPCHGNKNKMGSLWTAFHIPSFTVQQVHVRLSPALDLSCLVAGRPFVLSDFRLMICGTSEHV